MECLAPEALVRLEQALAATAALRAAAELRVLERLENGPVAASALAADFRLEPRGVERLLTALVGLGLVETEDGRRFRSRFACTDGLRQLMAIWDDLPSALRGQRARASVDTRAGAENLYPYLTPWLGAMFAGAAERAADRLAAPGLRVLDAGTGAAPWSIAVCRRGAGTCVTAVDLPAVLPAARRAVEIAGLAEAFEFLPGDVFSVDWGSECYDLAIAGNLCHLFDEAANRRLLERLRLALRSEGTLAIIDVLPDETPRRALAVELYALGLFIRSETGRAHPLSAYARWLADEGFDRVEAHELTAAPPLSLIVARRVR